MAINTNNNIPSLRTDRQIESRTKATEKSFEKLSSGKDINKASDNPAGLAVALELLANAATGSVAARNISDGVSAASIAEGAVASASEISEKMVELAQQASSGTVSAEQRTALNNQYQALSAELDRIAQTTEFNGQKLLSGSTTYNIQAGTNGSSTSQIPLPLPGVSSSGLGLTADLSSQESARQALEQSTSAVSQLASARGEIGGTVNRLDSAYENLKISELNSRAAASRILDADMAKEAANLVASKIGLQSAVAVKAQANIMPDLALKLLG